VSAAQNAWPALPLAPWESTRATLHMYAQIVGKIRLTLAPHEPQWGHVALFVTARGLTTGPMRLRDRTFAIDFDLLAHEVRIDANDGAARALSLLPAKSVADFYAALMGALDEMGLHVAINTMPQEVANPIPFPADITHATYDPGPVTTFFRILSLVDAAMKAHRAPFRGRQSPVQFFWGTFDLAYARFSGRPATPPSNNIIMREAMDAEEICAGFWVGDERFPEPGFWCYAYPKPDGLEKLTIAPATASWNAEMGEFILRYEDVRSSASPFDTLAEFFRTTYDVSAAKANWPKF
jgi:hypothetical protein